MEGAALPIRLAVFDLDGTLLTGTKVVMPALADALWEAGLRRGLGARLFALAGLAGLARKARLVSREAYTHYGTKLIVRWMAAVEPAQLESVLTETARKLLLSARTEVVAEMESRKHEGCRAVVVSAVAQPLLEQIARRLGCDAVGTRLEKGPDGRLTGRIEGPYCSGPGKVEALKAWAATLPEPVDWSGSCAYADTLPDLSVLEAVGTAIAVAPEPPLRQVALTRGWRVMEG